MFLFTQYTLVVKKLICSGRILLTLAIKSNSINSPAVNGCPCLLTGEPLRNAFQLQLHLHSLHL